MAALVSGSSPLLFSFFFSFIANGAYLLSLKEKYHLKEVVLVEEEEKPVPASAIELSAARLQSAEETQTLTGESHHIHKHSYHAVQQSDVERHTPVHFLNEPEADAIDDTAPIVKQMNEIWQTVQLQSVWQPMTFVFLFNLFQVPNVAWQSYLQLSLVRNRPTDLCCPFLSGIQLLASVRISRRGY